MDGHDDPDTARDQEMLGLLVAALNGTLPHTRSTLRVRASAMRVPIQLDTQIQSLELQNGHAANRACIRCVHTWAAKARFSCEWA
jgi:hypothetical protein